MESLQRRAPPPSLAFPGLQPNGATAHDTEEPNRARKAADQHAKRLLSAASQSFSTSEAKRLPYRKRRQAQNDGNGVPQPAHSNLDSSSDGWSRTNSTASTTSLASLASFASAPDVTAKATSRLGLKLRRAVAKSRNLKNFLQPLTCKVDALREEINSVYKKYDEAMKVLRPDGSSAPPNEAHASAAETPLSVGMRVCRHAVGVSSPKLRGSRRVVTSVLVSIERVFSDSPAWAPRVKENMPVLSSAHDFLHEEPEDPMWMSTSRGLREAPNKSLDDFYEAEDSEKHLTPQSAERASLGCGFFLSPQRRYLPGIGRCIVRKNTTHHCALVSRRPGPTATVDVTVDTDARAADSDASESDSQKAVLKPAPGNVTGGVSSQNYVLLTGLRRTKEFGEFHGLPQADLFRRTSSW
jgi:hypothetical protein